jgi:hypothetical protein
VSYRALTAPRPAGQEVTKYTHRSRHNLERTCGDYATARFVCWSGCHQRTLWRVAGALTAGGSAREPQNNARKSLQMHHNMVPRFRVRVQPVASGDSVSGGTSQCVYARALMHLSKIGHTAIQDLTSKWIQRTQTQFLMMCLCGSPIEWAQSSLAKGPSQVPTRQYRRRRSHRRRHRLVRD